MSTVSVFPLAPDFLEQLYEAAGDSAALAVVLDRLAGVLNGGVAAIHEYDFAAAKGHAVVSARLTPDMAAAYRSHYSRISPWMRGGPNQVKPGSVIVSHELYPDDALRRTEFCADFLEPQDVFHSIGAVASLDRTVMSTVTVLRSRRFGQFNDPERQYMTELLPHFHAVLRLHRKIETISHQRDTAVRVLDLFAMAVVVLDERARITGQNQAALDVLGRRDGLSIVGDRFVGATPRVTQQIATAVDSVARAPSEPGASASVALAVPRTHGQGNYSLLFCRLPASSPCNVLAGVKVAVFISEPSSRRVPNEEALISLFGLTAAEARLATKLANGMTLEQAASNLSVTRETIRTHLKRIFDKTSTTRQADLARLLTGLLPPIR